MIRYLAPLLIAPTLAQADVLICEFELQNCPAHVECLPFEITIDTHHGPDEPRFLYEGQTASIVEVPGDTTEAASFVTLGHADREIITLFNGFDAIHTRHYTIDGVPTAETAIGDCVSFY